MKDKTDIVFDECLVFEPAKPIKKTEYYCDKLFHVKSIQELYITSELIGLVYINGENCELYTVDIDNCDRNKTGEKSAWLKQHKKGGQSSARFGRLFDAKVKTYLKDISEEMRQCFKDVDKIVISGISTRPSELIQYLHPDVSSKIIGTLVIPSINYFNVKIIPKLKELVLTKDIEKELKLLTEFTDCIEICSDKAVYGEKEIEEALNHGLIRKIFCSNEKKLENVETIIIGKSMKGQELISIYGDMFGLKWY